MGAKRNVSLSTFDAFKHVKVDSDLIRVEGDVLHRLQRVLLMMLKDFDALCSQEGLTYTLGGGSCLGAVRHHGFIPWDDDLDVNMSRESFDKLCKVFASRPSTKYILQAPGDSGYELGFGRIRLRNTTLKTRDDFDETECGVYIDIFIIENAPSSPVARFFHGVVSQALGFRYSCRRFFEHKDTYLALAGDDDNFAHIIRVKSGIGHLFSRKTTSQCCLDWDKRNSKYSDKNTGFITIPVGRKHYFGELLAKEKYFPASSGTFEDMLVPLPHSADTYLKGLYGPEYMEVPPADDRESHVVYEIDFGPYA